MSRSKKALKWLSAAGEILDGSAHLVYTPRELLRHLDQSVAMELKHHRPSQDKLPQVLQKAGLLQIVDLYPLDRKPGSKDRPLFTRYTRERAVPLAIAQSLRAGSYLCHATAAALHDIAPAGNTIYVNKEQGPKPRPTGGLSQEGITRALTASPRFTSYQLTDGTHTYILLNGKHTDAAGVEDLDHEQGTLRVTNLARTVVDLIVRPQYAGGAQAVLDAIRRAIGRVRVDDLANVLKDLDYVYPYHQALGFYLEKAGSPGPTLAPIHQWGMEYDFYLEQGATPSTFDAKWRIHYPAQLR